MFNHKLCTQPETFGETQADGRVQLQVYQLFWHVFDAVAGVVKLGTRGVGVDTLVVHLWQEHDGGNAWGKKDVEEERTIRRRHITCVVV